MSEITPQTVQVKSWGIGSILLPFPAPRFAVPRDFLHWQIQSVLTPSSSHSSEDPPVINAGSTFVVGSDDVDDVDVIVGVIVGSDTEPCGSASS